MLETQKPQSRRAVDTGLKKNYLIESMFFPAIKDYE